MQTKLAYFTQRSGNDRSWITPDTIDIFKVHFKFVYCNPTRYKMQNANLWWCSPKLFCIVLFLPKYSFRKNNAIAFVFAKTFYVFSIFRLLCILYTYCSWIRHFHLCSCTSHRIVALRYSKLRCRTYAACNPHSLKLAKNVLWSS